MKHLFAAFFLLLLPLLSHAQPFGAMDKNVYLPNVGVGGEIDTICGRTAGQGLGAPMFGLPPRPGEAFGTAEVSLASTRFGDYASLTTFDGGHVNLRDSSLRHRVRFPLNVYAKIHLGHFHSPRYTDILLTGGGYNRIYWEDEAGNYDSNRYTELFTNFHKRANVDREFGPVFITHAVSDSVDDLIIGTEVIRYPVPGAADDCMALYQGGEHLFSQGSEATCDSIIEIQVRTDTTGLDSRIDYGFYGNWRGTNRADLITVGRYGDLFYFRNDPPFSMQKLKDSWNDTLFAFADNPIGDIQFKSILSMPALAKPSGDTSKDFLVTYDLTRKEGLAVCIFRGGPDFGSHRLTVDSAAFIIPNPGIAGGGYDGGFGRSLTDCGDMSGSGDHMLCVQGAYDLFSNSFNFYQTGRELDEKIDMYYYMESNFPCYVTPIAGINHLQDVLVGVPGFDLPPKQDVGTLQLVHGSKLIPHTSSTVFGPSSIRPELSLWPLPMHGFITASFSAPTEGETNISVSDLLGRSVYTRHQRFDTGRQSVGITIPNLLSGLYQLEIRGEGWSTSRSFICN